jgi:pimeloyl-ACP methyl ester carboxylesterase
MVEAPDGVMLCLQEWGNASGPEIVFIHGYSQSHLSWQRQFEGELAATFRLITYDLRGHGDSGKPLDLASYRESERWAQDLNSVLGALRLKRPVLVGWSYAGRVICDYLLSYGDRSIAGINFVCARTKNSPEGDSPGGKFISAMGSDELTTNIESTLAFLRLCTTQPLPTAEFETILAFNMVTPAQVRAHMQGRSTPYEDALRSLRVPVLVTHGEKDQIVSPSIGRYTASVIPHAVTSFYPEAGHMPFWEDAPRFNRELAAFVDRAQT